MRILLEECLPRKLKKDLSGHTVATAPEMGWASAKNGRLLSLAEEQFDVFLTVDRSLPYQQNLRLYNIVIIVLLAPNWYKDLQPLMSKVKETKETIDTAQAGTVVQVEI